MAPILGKLWDFLGTQEALEDGVFWRQRFIGGECLLEVEIG